MIFGDLVCCVHFVVLFQCCIAVVAVVAPADPPSLPPQPPVAPVTPVAANETGAGSGLAGTVEERLTLASPLIQTPPTSGAGSRSLNRSGKYTEDGATMPGELNEYCRVPQDCRQHAYVCDTRQQVCGCAEGYRADDTGRICLGAVGRRCMYDSHCVTNAYCKGQMICTCKREYGFLADDNWSCQASSARYGTQLPGMHHFLALLAMAITVPLLRHSPATTNAP
ncbi:uncharacterized protein LOC126569672 isoform X1 [Anopheles aquasalis]|uniref:uncharacterized protein LOC126569672 isoform X1 n=1 Tax=Anopheles aquasalis TaxID=42839 RepID=UPI00215AE836|nr:uncharacterized protein LOC126569672 isoform X1 [Anopheles aquasalis]